jgi:hypothetical protein
MIAVPRPGPGVKLALLLHTHHGKLPARACASVNANPTRPHTTVELVLPTLSPPPRPAKKTPYFYVQMLPRLECIACDRFRPGLPAGAARPPSAAAISTRAGGQPVPLPSGAGGQHHTRRSTRPTAGPRVVPWLAVATRKFSRTRALAPILAHMSIGDGNDDDDCWLACTLGWWLCLSSAARSPYLPDGTARAHRNHPRRPAPLSSRPPPLGV